jgi:indolepyruvate ferredoxin oxidoreductase
MLALGVAYQAGLLPLSAGAIEQAVRLNGVQAAQNLQAFRYGRLWVADPARVRALVEPPAPSADAARAAVLARLGGARAAAYVSLLDRCRGLDEEARRMLALRVGELIDYQDARYASAYVDFVLVVAAREAAAGGGRTEIAHAVIRSLYKLMAYKDEYEVARLHLKASGQTGPRALFAAPRRLTWHFHPPLLRALGLRRKLRLGPWFTPALRALRAGRRLRGTPLDPFGYAAVRREERRLVPWYRELVARALDRLGEDGHDRALELARLPEAIRGYEDIKLRSIAAARERAAALGAAAAR